MDMEKLATPQCGERPNVTVKMFESKVLNAEGICLVLRKSARAQHPCDYPFVHGVPDDMLLVTYLGLRLLTRLHGAEFEIIDGRGVIVTQKNMVMGELRATYKR